MDPQQPEAKQQAESSASPVTPPHVGSRPYPKPPAILKRLILLCLKPEAWPAAARYPLWVTLVPLFLAILIAAGVVGTVAAMNVMRGLHSFAQSYDARYPQLDLNSDGLLSVKDPARQPVEFLFGDERIVVDTTGKTSFDSIKDPSAALVNSHEILLRFNGYDSDPREIKAAIPLLVPEKGGVTHINGTTLQQLVRDRRPELVASFAIVLVLMKLLTETLWVAITMFLIFPAVSIGAAVGRTRLFIPKRAAYRIAAAVLVPIVLFSAFTSAAGYSVSAVVGGENSILFWFFSAAALAFWGGYMAKGMFVPKVVRRRTT